MSSRIRLCGGGQVAFCLSVAAFIVTASSLLAAPLASGAEGGGSIAGTLTAEGTNAPLGGVEVCAFALEEEEFPTTCTNSNDDGEYTVSPLAPGRYKVEFHPGEAGLNYVGEAWDDQPSWPDGDEIQVGSEPVTGIDADFAEGGEIHGRVVDAGTGAALPGVTVCAFPISTFRVWSCALTGFDGRYAITGNEAGLHEVAFFVEDEGTEYLPQFYNGHNDYWLATNPVQVAVGEVTADIDAALAKRGRITGRVTDAITHLGIAAAEVCAFQAGIFETRECVGTGPTGEYSIGRLPPGTYKVTFFPASFADGKLGEEEREANAYLTQYFDNATLWDEADPIGLGSGATVSGIDAGLVRRDARLEPVPLVLKPQRCKKGFRKLTVKGRTRCRKVVRCRKGFKKKMVKGKRRCVRSRRGTHRVRR